MGEVLESSEKVPSELICQMCAEKCDITEVVDIGIKQFELWCYCEKCDIETFHPLWRDVAND